MTLENRLQYNGIAIGLHWLIALSIIGMLVLGKYMTGLDESDSSRYHLTQLHKSIGISLLLLSFLRLSWRLLHRAPLLPEKMPDWEKLAAHLTHIAFYLLIIGIPLSGWILVSASPLNLPTVLFKTWPWPHLPPFTTLENKEQIADMAHFVHVQSSNLLILLLILHIVAALRHQFILRDNLMFRMSPIGENGQFVLGIGKLFAILLVGVAAAVVYAGMQKTETPVSVTGDATVSFTVPLMGDDLTGVFSESEVTVQLDKTNHTNSMLSARVPTGNITTSESSVTETLKTAEWFDSSHYPIATFESSNITRDRSEHKLYVNGELKLKDSSQNISFTLNLDPATSTATGAFTINRLDFNIGAVEQPDDSTVGFNVLIEFSFPVD